MLVLDVTPDALLLTESVSDAPLPTGVKKAEIAMIEFPEPRTTNQEVRRRQAKRNPNLFHGPAAQ